jgi:hypothetical protein
LAIKPAWLELTGHVDVLFRRLAARKLHDRRAAFEPESRYLKNVSCALPGTHD